MTLTLTLIGYLPSVCMSSCTWSVALLLPISSHSAPICYLYHIYIYSLSLRVISMHITSSPWDVFIVYSRVSFLTPAPLCRGRRYMSRLTCSLGFSVSIRVWRWYSSVLFTRASIFLAMSSRYVYLITELFFLSLKYPFLLFLCDGTGSRCQGVSTTSFWWNFLT